MQDGELRLVASSLSFSTLLSLVPFLAVTLSIFKEVGGLEFFYPKVEAFVLSYLEQATSRQAMQVVQRILQRIQAGALGTTGAVILVFTSFKLLHDMERGVNRVWNEKELRPFYRRLALNMFFLVLFPLVMAIYAGFRSIAFFRPYFKANLQNLTDFFLLFGGLFLIYKLVPHVKVQNRPAVISALLASALLLGLKNSFTWLAQQVFTYSKVYGSLATLPLLCLWILGVWHIVLAGVAFCASSQKRRWLEENQLT